MNQLKAGAALSYVNIILTIIISLTYTPIMLRLLGQAEYGLYSLIGALVGYLSILDLGLGNTIIRYTAKNRITGDKQSEAQLNGMFLSFYFIIGILTAIVGGILYTHIDVIFSTTLTSAEIEKAKIMTILLIFNISVAFPLSIFASIMQAYEKFIYLRIFNILRVLLNPILVLPLLYMGYDSVMMVVVATALNIGCLLVNVYYVFRYLNTTFQFGHFKNFPLTEIAVYSFFIFLNAILDKVYWSTGQFILGIHAGTKAVAVYAIAMQFAMMYMTFSSAISGVLLPKVTMMVANKASNLSLSKLMIKIGRIQYILIGYIFAAFILYGEQFLYLWAGEVYLEAYEIIVIIMFALLTPLIQNTGIAILQAKNLNKFRMTIYSGFALLNIFVSIPLAKLYGGIGCAAATGGALFISAGIIINLYYHKMGLDIILFWKNIMRLTIPILLAVFISYCISLLIIGQTWIVLLSQIVAFSFIYLIIMYYWGINTEEKKLIVDPLKKILAKKLME